MEREYSSVVFLEQETKLTTLNCPWQEFLHLPLFVQQADILVAAVTSQ